MKHNVSSGQYLASISPVWLSTRTEISMSGAPLVYTFLLISYIVQLSGKIKQPKGGTLLQIRNFSG